MRSFMATQAGELVRGLCADGEVQTLSGLLWEPPGAFGGFAQDSDVIKPICWLLCGDVLEGTQPGGRGDGQVRMIKE